MKIGMQELLVIFVIALIVLGPDKLPLYAKKLGEALGQFKKYSSEATKEIRESVVEPLQEAQRPLKEAMEPINDLQKTVRNDMNDLKKSFTDIGKPTSGQSDVKSEANIDTAADQPSVSEQTADSISSDISAESEASQTVSEAPDPASEKISSTDAVREQTPKDTFDVKEVIQDPSDPVAEKAGQSTAV